MILSKRIDKENIMLTRRDAMALGAAAIGASALPLVAWAEENGSAEVIAKFTGGADIKDGGVDIGAPEIAENGNTVPVSVTAVGASAILLIAAGNPRPEVATFHFGKLSAGAAASTRIRLAQTQDLIAVAKMKDGTFAKGVRTVKVTIGGCGG